jgi:hypothetical protein
MLAHAHAPVAAGINDADGSADAAYRVFHVATDGTGPARAHHRGPFPLGPATALMGWLSSWLVGADWAENPLSVTSVAAAEGLGGRAPLRFYCVRQPCELLAVYVDASHWVAVVLAPLASADAVVGDAYLRARTLSTALATALAEGDVSVGAPSYHLEAQVVHTDPSPRSTLAALPVPPVGPLTASLDVLATVMDRPAGSVLRLRLCCQFEAAPPRALAPTPARPTPLAGGGQRKTSGLDQPDLSDEEGSRHGDHGGGDGSEADLPKVGDTVASGDDGATSTTADDEDADGYSLVERPSLVLLTETAAGDSAGAAGAAAVEAASVDADALASAMEDDREHMPTDGPVATPLPVPAVPVPVPVPAPTSARVPSPSGRASPAAAVAAVASRSLSFGAGAQLLEDADDVAAPGRTDDLVAPVGRDAPAPPSTAAAGARARLPPRPMPAAVTERVAVVKTAAVLRVLLVQCTWAVARDAHLRHSVLTVLEPAAAAAAAAGIGEGDAVAPSRMVLGGRELRRVGGRWQLVEPGPDGSAAASPVLDEVGGAGVRASAHQGQWLSHGRGGWTGTGADGVAGRQRAVCANVGRAHRRVRRQCQGAPPAARAPPPRTPMQPADGPCLPRQTFMLYRPRTAQHRPPSAPPAAVAAAETGDALALSSPAPPAAPADPANSVQGTHGFSTCPADGDYAPPARSG